VSEHARYPTARAAARAQARQLGRLRTLRLLIALALTALALLLPSLAHAQDWQTIAQSRQRTGESALRVDVEYAAGTLTLASAGSGELYRMSMRYNAEAFTPRVAYDANRLQIGMQDARIRGRNMRTGTLDLKLSPDVPVDLALSFGAAEAEINLGGVLVRSVRIQTGASKTRLNVSMPNPQSCRLFSLEAGAARFEGNRLGNLNAERIRVQGGVGDVVLDFSGSWEQDMSGTVEMGLGSLTLALPRGLGVHIRKGGLLASFDSQGLIKRGDAFYSQDWETAERKLSLSIDAALGSIKVVWLDG
jgi:hypothetical protein